MSDTRAIDSIIVGPRFRKDFAGVEALAASIAAVGLLQPPGVTPAGRLLWGECRLRACRSLGWAEIPVTVCDVDSTDFVAIEAAENFARKDFTLSEAVAIKRAMEPAMKAAAESRMKAGQPLPNLDKGRTADKVAAYTGFGRTSLTKAEAVVEAAEAEPEKYGKLLTDMDRTGRVNGAWRRLSNMQQAEKIRAEPPPLPQGPFRVGSIDVPWPYEPDDENPERRAVLPYPTMTLEAIRGLPVADLMGPDSILWTWATNHYMREALDLLAGWGFQPKTMLTWAKDRFGLGSWLRGQTEHAILAVRGRPVVTLTNQSTFFQAPMRGNSEKPDEFYALVEQLCPAPPGGYVELFARKPRPGWVTWGDEVPKAAAAE